MFEQLEDQVVRQLDGLWLVLCWVGFENCNISALFLDALSFVSSLHGQVQPEGGAQVSTLNYWHVDWRPFSLFRNQAWLLPFPRNACRRTHEGVCTLNNAHCTLHNAHCTLHNAHLTLYNAQCAHYIMDSTQYTLWSAHCIVSRMQSEVCSGQCAVWSVQCAVRSMKCAV